MTIKQQGGIFGRNPSFNDVSVETFGVGTDDPLGDVQFNKPNPDFYMTSANGGQSDIFFGSVSSPSEGNIKYSTFDNSMRIWTNGAEAVRLEGDGDVNVRIGNVIMSSGKGIDFSATSGTGTSELFDDYEEGTWTPSLYNYDGTPTVSGYYVKIGQMVYVECSIALDGTSDASIYIITDLPFTMASPQLGGGAVNTNDGGVADALVGSDASGRLRLRDSSGVSQTYNSIGVSSTVTLNAQYRAA